MVVAVVLGGLAVAVGNWWTAVAMLLLLVGQGLAERDARRRAAPGVTPVTARSRTPRA